MLAKEAKISLEGKKGLRHCCGFDSRGFRKSSRKMEEKAFRRMYYAGGASKKDTLSGG